MNNKLIIYQNEADLLKDEIKKRFYKKYNNLQISITMDVLNDLLKGMNIRIVDPLLNDARSFYAWTRDIKSTGEYISDIFLKINEKLLEMINNHYLN